MIHGYIFDSCLYLATNIFPLPLLIFTLLRNRFSKGGDFSSFPLHKFNSTLDEYTHKVDEEERRKERTTCDELYTRMNKLVDEKNKLSLQLQQTVNTCDEEKKRADKWVLFLSLSRVNILAKIDSEVLPEFWLKLKISSKLANTARILARLLLLRNSPIEKKETGKS